MGSPPAPDDDEQRGIPRDVGSNEFLEASDEEPISVPHAPNPRPYIESEKVVFGTVGLELAAMVILGFVLIFVAVWAIGPYYEDNIAIWIFVACIISSIVFLFMHRRTLYRQITAVNDHLPQDPGSSSVPRACMICYKHPVSKRYHLKKVHGMKKVNRQIIRQNFYACGCAICHESNDLIGG